MPKSPASAPQILEFIDDDLDSDVQTDFKEQAAFFTLSNLSIGQILSVEERE